MNIVETLKIELQKYPHINYEIKRNILTVFSNNERGFNISITIIKYGGCYTVNCGGSILEFDTEDQAIHHFWLALSDKCRLKIFFRGNFKNKLILERQEGEKWVVISTTSHMFYPFWRKQSEKYFQNNLIR